MKNLIKRTEFKTNIKNDIYYILRYYQNDILINLRFLEKKGNDFEELFPGEIKNEKAEELILIINENINLTPLTDEEVKELDNKTNEYLSIAKRLIIERLKAEKKVRKFVQIGEIAGNIYLITKNKDSFFSDIFTIRLKDKGTNSEVFLINQSFAELSFLDHIAQVIIGKNPKYIKLNDIFYIGIIRSTFKGQPYFSVGIIEFLGDNLSCNKSYLLETDSKGKYKPLGVEKFTKEVIEALKYDIDILCETFLTSLIS